MKRKDYISWDDYFMGVAILSSYRSKDPNTQVGACIVGEDNRIISTGYNGFPNGCSDDILPWNKNGEFLDVKYSYVSHAEMNCIISAKRDLKNCVLYVSLFPCNECSKIIIQSGIKQIYYLDDKYIDTNSCKASIRMFDLSGVKYEKYEPKENEINIYLKRER